MRDIKGRISKLCISDWNGPVIFSGSVDVDSIRVIFVTDVVDEVRFLFKFFIPELESKFG